MSSEAGAWRHSTRWASRLAAVVTCVVLVFSGTTGAGAVDINDPSTDSGGSNGDIYGVVMSLTPTTLTLKVLTMAPVAVAARPGDDGLAFRVTIHGTRWDGTVDTQIVDVAGDGSQNEANGDYCPGDTAEALTSSATLTLDNTIDGCFGHFAVAAVAVETQYISGGAQVVSDRAPDSGYGDPVVAVAPESQWVAVYGGGTIYPAFSYVNNPWFATCLGCQNHLSFGQGGDTLLTADTAPVPACQVVPTQSCLNVPFEGYLDAVRTTAGGGLLWYQRYAQDRSLLPFPSATQQTSVRSFAWGNAGDVPVSGDWDGDGVTTIGLFRPSTGQWFLTDDPNFGNVPGAALTVISFGSPGDQPVVGDWTGEGRSLPGVFRNGHWYELHTLRSGGSDFDFTYGQAGDIAVPGDWNQDGVQTPAVYRNGQWFQTNNRLGGSSANSFTFGGPGYRPIVATPVW